MLGQWGFVMPVQCPFSIQVFLDSSCPRGLLPTSFSLPVHSVARPLSAMSHSRKSLGFCLQSFWAAPFAQC